MLHNHVRSRLVPAASLSGCLSADLFGAQVAIESLKQLQAAADSSSLLADTGSKVSAAAVELDHHQPVAAASAQASAPGQPSATSVQQLPKELQPQSGPETAGRQERLQALLVDLAQELAAMPGLNPSEEQEQPDGLQSPQSSPQGESRMPVHSLKGLLEQLKAAVHAQRLQHSPAAQAPGAALAAPGPGAS